MTPDLAAAFPRYTDFDPLVPVYCATPGEGRMIHRFFDSSPISPGGRYLGLTQLPYEERSPKAGEWADVVVVDLATGEQRVVATTAAWGSQLGAQVQWGATDTELYFNDMYSERGADGLWEPFGVRYNIETDERRDLAGTIYHISPDGRNSVSPCLRRTARTQLGYGVMVPRKFVPQNVGAPADDGVFVTDLESGEGRLLVSLADIVGGVEHLTRDTYKDGEFYAFHTKWSPDGARIMVVLRWASRVTRRWWQREKPASKKTMRKFVLTIAADGSDPRMAISDELWARGGHHPNWCSDNRHVMMNLNLNGDGLRFVQADLDGRNVRLMHPTVEGSGHPSLHPNGRFLLTDSYPGEEAGFGDGTVPIRLIDLETGDEKVIVRIMSKPAYVGPRKEMRLDAHPAWDRTGNYVIFNGCPDGTRRVFIADMRELLQE